MTEPIQSAQNHLVKRLKELAQDASARREAGLYLIEGPKLCAEALAGGAKIRQAVATPEGPMRLALHEAGLDILELGEKAFASISDTQSPQGVMLLVEMRQGAMPDPSKLSLAVAAERLQDPGNLGAALRSAWACGAEAVYLGEGCADPYSPKAVRAAAGAQRLLAIETQVALPERLALLRKAGLQVLALEAGAKASLWDADLKKPTVLVLGSEGQGLSTEVLAACGGSLRLPYPGQTESLNAAVSLSLALFEALRQRQK